MIGTYTELLEKVALCPLPLAFKLDALQTVAMSKIEHNFVNTTIKEEQLETFDKLLVKTLRRVFSIETNTTVRTFFQNKSKGGLGVRKPSIIYRAARVNFLIHMLNHNDENFRFVARKSFEIDMTKRGVLRSDAENNFLGYNLKESGHLDTNIKGGFGVQSDWPQLCLLARKLSIRILWENANVGDLMLAGKAYIRHNNRDFRDEKLIRKKLIEIQLALDGNILSSLPMQGTTFALDDADYLLSQNIFKNFKLSDKLIQFWYKARHNVIPCNYTLSLWYPQHEPACTIDNYPKETVSHLLNSCKNFKDNYSKRHDRIVDKLSEELSDYWNVIGVNKMITTVLPGIDFSNPLKPDIVIRNKKQVKIIDIACPYDLHLESTYNQKILYYNDLKQNILTSGLECEVYAIVIGSLGIVHNKALKTLQTLQMPKTRSKGFLKWASTSNIIAAKIIWNVRCRLVNE